MRSACRTGRPKGSIISSVCQTGESSGFRRIEAHHHIPTIGTWNITLQTKDLMPISCGVPSIPLELLKETVDQASEFIIRFCGGEVSKPIL